MAIFSVLKANYSNKQNTVSRFKNWWLTDFSMQAVKSNWQIVEDSCIDIPNKRLSLPSPLDLFLSVFFASVIDGQFRLAKTPKSKALANSFRILRQIMRMKRNWLFNELKHGIWGLIGLLWNLYLARIPTGCYKNTTTTISALLSLHFLFHLPQFLFLLFVLKSDFSSRYRTQETCVCPFFNPMNVTFTSYVCKYSARYFFSVYIFGVYVLCCLRWDKTFDFFYYFCTCN